MVPRDTLLFDIVSAAPPATPTNEPSNGDSKKQYSAKNGSDSGRFFVSFNY